MAAILIWAFAGSHAAAQNMTAEGLKSIKPLRSATEAFGISAAEVNRIRSAAGTLKCPSWKRPGWSGRSTAWVINSGRQILAVLHAVVDIPIDTFASNPGTKDYRVKANPSRCYFVSALDGQRVSVEAISLKPRTNYLYLRGTEAAPELIETAKFLGRETPNLRVLGFYGTRDDYIVLDLRVPMRQSAALKLTAFEDVPADFDNTNYHKPSLLLVAAPPRGMTSADLVIQECDYHAEQAEPFFVARTAGRISTRCYVAPGMSGGLYFLKHGEELVTVAMNVAGDSGAGWVVSEALTWNRKLIEYLPERNLFSPRRARPRGAIVPR